MKINIITIPHEEQKYDTVDDYWYDEAGTLQVRISQQPFKSYEFLILIHSLIEWFLSEVEGITPEEITKFDIKFEETNYKNKQPGDEPSAPYFIQHQFATKIESQLARILNINWNKYMNDESYKKLSTENKKRKKG